MMDKNREAFEAWYLKDPENSPAYLASDDRGYLDDTVQMDWALWSEAWGASRHAIEVEMHEAYDDGHGNEWLPKDSTIKAITSLGIRVKGNEE